MHVNCAVGVKSRFRFIRFAAHERAETTLMLLAECLEEPGGAPEVVLSDRMGCLRGDVVVFRLPGGAGERSDAGLGWTCSSGPDSRAPVHRFTQRFLEIWVVRDASPPAHRAGMHQPVGPTQR